MPFLNQSVRTVFASLALFVLLSACAGHSKPKYVPPSLAMSHNNRGVQYLAQTDLDKAEWEFKTAAEMDPKYAEAWNNLGLVYKYKADYPKALHFLERATKANPKWASPYNHLGAVYISMGEIGQAIPYIKKAIEKDKKYADAYYNLGVCYHEMVRLGVSPDQNRKKAIKAMKKATDLDEFLYHAHSDLGDMYREVQDWESALIRYRLAIETRPNDAEFWIKLATLYMEMKDPERAEPAFARAQQIEMQNGSQAQDSEALLGYGEALTQSGKAQEAIPIFEFITRNDPNSERAYFSLGYAHYQAGNYNEAVSAYQRALHLNPDFVEASYNLGLAYASLGDRKNAIHAYQNALAADPHHARTLYNLGMLYHDRGDLAGARKNLCRFIDEKPEQYAKEIQIARQIAREDGGCSGQ